MARGLGRKQRHGDTFEIMKGTDPKTRPVVICLGQKAFWAVPSKGGKTAQPVKADKKAAVKKPHPQKKK